MSAGSNEHMVERVNRIARKLDLLAAKDNRFLVPGAGSHRYQMRPPLSEARVSRIEKRIKIRFPEEYRLFVTRVGEGGAGPYYGVLALDSNAGEVIVEDEKVRKPFRWTEAFNPYDWEDPAADEDVLCDGDEEYGVGVMLFAPGALCICNFGCGIRFFLVVNGSSVGEVWRDSQIEGKGFSPECGADGKHLGFFDWYEGWLDKALSG
jgi:hypothetical protein